MLKNVLKHNQTTPNIDYKKKEKKEKKKVF